MLSTLERHLHDGRWMMERLAHERIYCDTNALIHAVENFSHAARELLRFAGRGDVSLYTSHLTLHEVMVSPIAKGQSDLAKRYSETIDDPEGLEIVEVDEEVLLASASLRAIHKKLDIADAIHIASATLADCSFMLSEDQAMDDFLPDNIERLTLANLEVEIST